MHVRLILNTIIMNNSIFENCYDKLNILLELTKLLLRKIFLKKKYMHFCEIYKEKSEMTYNYYFYYHPYLIVILLECSKDATVLIFTFGTY
jgi:hypothetical protein